MRKPGWREPGWGKFAPYGWGLLALALILPALGPLFRPGFFVSDDGRFHVYRIAALAEAWQQGVLYPRLFPGFGFGYGQAVLNYYAPLSYYPGALLTLAGFGPSGAAKLTIALGFLLAGLAAYGYGRSIWGAPGGILAAVAYTYFPYHLADAYLRGAIPEHFAFIWPPLILWCYTVAFRGERPRAALLWSALAWAGLVYTHNLTAALMVPVAALYLLFLAGWTKKWRRLLPAVGALVLALCLSAPLWLPFLAESRFVGIAQGLSDGYRKHLAPLGSFVSLSPLYGYEALDRSAQPGGAVDHPLSWVTVVIILLVGGLALWRVGRGRLRPHRSAPTVGGPVILFSLLLALGSAFMVTAASLPVWLPLAPLLAHLQYPWRFLSLTALGAAGLAAALPSLLAGTPEQERTLCLKAGPEDAVAIRPHRLARRVLLAALAAVTLVLIVQPLPNLPAQPLVITAAETWAPDRMWREDAEAGQVGATWTGEFLPLTVQEQRWALGRPKSGAVDGPAAAARPSVRLASLGYDRLELDIQTEIPLSVRLHQFHLPAWMARLDGRVAPTVASGELGLVSADVPGGAHGLAFQFGPTPAWIAAACLAILAAAVWAALAWREWPHAGKYTRFAESCNRKLRAGAVVLIVLLLLFTLNGLGLGRRSWVPRPASAAIEDVALLLGYDVTPAHGADALDVTLYWFALREVGTDYKAFVHLLDGGGQVVAQHDGDPGGGYSPTTRWLPGEIVPDRHRLPLPAGQPGGEYTLKAGMYQFEPMRVLSVDPPAADGRVDLGRVRLPLQGSETR